MSSTTAHAMTLPSGLHAEMQSFVGDTASLFLTAPRADCAPVNADAVCLELSPADLAALARWNPDDLTDAPRSTLWWRVSLAGLAAVALAGAAHAAQHQGYTPNVALSGATLDQRDALALGALAAAALAERRD